LEAVSAGVSGDGFIVVADGTRRWGRFGAAGILVRHTDDDGTVSFFLARRSEFCHRGGTWAIPGGARNQDEDALAAALREFAEEIGVPLHEHEFEMAHIHEDDHGGWSYTTIVLDVAEQFPPPTSFNWETAEARWVSAGELAELELFDAFEATLRLLGLWG
jgi:8-oxo-dGTP diphosphatase